MAIARGSSISIRTQDGMVKAVLFYDDVNGRPVRVDTERTTARDYEVELQGGGSAQKLSFVVPMGTASRNVTVNVAKDIDARPDIEGVFENLGECDFTLRI